MRLARRGFNADVVLARARFAVLFANRTPLSKPSSLIDDSVVVERGRASVVDCITSVIYRPKM